MNCIILAAGIGTRLKPFTDNIPKPCLKLKQGISIIGNIIKQINELDFIDRVIINTHYLPDRIMSEAIKHTDKSLIFTYEPTILGTAGAIENIKWMIGGRDDTLIIYGDLYLKIDFERYYYYYLENIKRKSGCLILLDKIKSEEEYLSKGIVEFDNEHRITSFAEKPMTLDNYHTDEHFYNAGIYFATSDTLKYMIYFGSDFGKHVFPTMINRGNEINCLPIDNQSEFVIDIGTIDKFKKYCEE